MTATDSATIERFEVTVGPFTFQARRAGPPDGRPVILLHGVPQTSACWVAQLEALAAAGHHAVAFTQRGYSPGARVDDVAAFTMDKLASDVLGVADALGFDSFDVVGHDAGAGVAWVLGGYHADRVETLTIASVPHPAAFANAYRSKGDGDSQHERSGYVWSDEDPAIGPEGAYATEQHVSGDYTFIVFEGIGHWIPETAAERLNQELLAHLAAHPRRRS
jgi:pimeloyl-ACP methyl ester carboxylesterase